ncbi:ankyrin repeat-containing domain protein [Gorgonomyces haynaldii]|nr:ankyrin repeat-containing domain protein [Gorgonomyces haynaldii]
MEHVFVLVKKHLTRSEQLRLLSTCRSLYQLWDCSNRRLSLQRYQLFVKTASIQQLVSYKRHKQMVKQLIDNKCEQNVQFYSFRRGIPTLCQLFLDMERKLWIVECVDLGIMSEFIEFCTMESLELNELQLASMSGGSQVCEMLLKTGFPPDCCQVIQSRDKRNTTVYPPLTPLILAVIHGHLDIVKLLIQYGAAVNPVHLSGDEVICSHALEIAIYFGRVHVYEWLQSQGLQLQQESIVNVIQSSLIHGQQDLFELSVQKCKNSDWMTQETLYAAARGGNLQLFERVIPVSKALTTMMSQSLQIAIENNHLDISMYLLDQFFEKCEDNDKRALSLAIECGNFKIFHHIIKERGDDLILKLKQSDVFELGKKNLKELENILKRGAVLSAIQAKVLLYHSIEQKQSHLFEMLMQFNPVVSGLIAHDLYCLAEKNEMKQVMMQLEPLLTFARHHKPKPKPEPISLHDFNLEYPSTPSCEEDGLDVPVAAEKDIVGDCVQEMTLLLE